MQVRADWLQVTRVFTQYVAPGLVVLALMIELSGLVDQMRRPMRVTPPLNHRLFRS